MPGGWIALAVAVSDDHSRGKVIVIINYVPKTGKTFLSLIFWGVERRASVIYRVYCMPPAKKEVGLEIFCCKKCESKLGK